MKEPAIRIEGLSRNYGAVQALVDLNLEVAAGSVFGFLGRNGAGKTTTIRLLTGLAQPTRGRAWIAGIETTAADSAARRVFGYLPQSPAFYSWMSPREYLLYCARLFEMPAAAAQRRTAEVLELVGLEKAAKRRIGGFSGGMIQRLGIAQALVHSPPVLILDEPTSALDPAGRYEVLDLIARLSGRVTVFLSSHILDDIERICDTVAMIRDGRLVLVAGRDELLRRYVSSAALLEPVAGAEISPEFVSALQALVWVAALQPEGSSLRVVVNDLEAAQAALLPLVAQHHLLLRRYEWVRPTLEEIFLREA